MGQAADLSGQMSGQAVQMNHVGGGSDVDVGGSADGLPQQHQQMQVMVGVSPGIDAQFMMLRNSMREKIFKYIGRKLSSDELRRRFPELAKRLEEVLFRQFLNKNDYYNMLKGPLEPHLKFAIKTINARGENIQQLKMMLRPSEDTRIPYVADNNALSSSGAGIVTHNANMGASMPEMDVQGDEYHVKKKRKWDEYEALEGVLINASAGPIKMSYAFLESITHYFSQEIGSGGFGVVYMGFLGHRKVAVKKLCQTLNFSEKQFKNELACLERVKHKNIARFLGYCSDTQEKPAAFDGKLVWAEERRRFLCFEYVPNKSLHDYLEDESRGSEWDTRYKLIEGICQGLHYLHNKRINHLDLKPENILLDAGMVPKIIDFGLSRRFSGEQSRIITETIRGSRGYIAPEYINKGEISFKSDIFCLGVIIRKLLVGSDQFSDPENWCQSLHIGNPQMKRCAEIAQLCEDDNPRKRPTMGRIISMLSKKEMLLRRSPRFLPTQEK